MSDRLQESPGAAGTEGADSSEQRDAATIGGLTSQPEGLAELSLDALAALTNRLAERLESDRVEEGAGELRQLAWDLLDLLRTSALLQRIAAADAVDAWVGHLLRLVNASHYTLGQMLPQRCARYGSRALFRLPSPNGIREISWRQTAGTVELVARGLLAMTADLAGAPLAVLSRNRLEMVMLDLACLSSGIVNAVIPATATDNEVAYIMRHAGARAVVVSDRQQLEKVLKARDKVPDLELIIAFEDAHLHPGVVAFDQVFERATNLSAEELAARRAAMRIDDLATIMYTSGTTGTPKGIRFSQRNIVFKRFARALALPEIGESDTFLCYLPLFHTFGRFFEMVGCVFWGATYVFAENPSIETLTRHMRDLEPTVFISIPLKWMDLYDQIRQEVDVEGGSDAEIRAAVRQVTGGELRWGLSAAGYLDPEIFRFFQRHGVEVMSGFGMTEATGGITMTPPGRYRDDSLGGALPGIEIALCDDGELKMRGPYVMMGYHDPPEGELSFDEDGWFHSGDIMEADEGGYIRLVDRKKEIYKNVKGQTVAPQKVENLFRDFVSVARIFLVGDHREYNTALIYPNSDFEELDLDALSADELHTHFRSLVVTANSFLSPFERIVDFAVIDRDFSAEHGELTPKGTYKRKAIERNFAEVIRQLYRRATLRVGDAEVTVPNWLVQALGITTQALRVEGDQLLLTSHGTKLTIKRISRDTVRVGSATYRHERRAVSLGYLLSSPRLWLGNEELVGFAPLEIEQRERRRRRSFNVFWLDRVAPHQPSEDDRRHVATLLGKQALDLMDLHKAALLTGSDVVEDAILAVRALEHAIDADDATSAVAARQVLRRASQAPLIEVRRRAFQVLAFGELPARYHQIIGAFLADPATLLDAETKAVLVERDLSPEQVSAFIAHTEAICLRVPEQPVSHQPPDSTATVGDSGGDAGEEAAGSSSDSAELQGALALLELLSTYGAAHPTRYTALRTCLTRLAMLAPAGEIRRAAARARWRMVQGFRQWLGEPRRVAVDPETGLEYRWEDVVAFADDVEEEVRKRILDAIRNTALLAEGAFLFTGGSTVRLESILPGGVWVRLLGSDHGKSVYRLAIKTRTREQFDLAVNVNRGLSPAEIGEEINWLIICAEGRGGDPLVEQFGGYWADYGLWTEEFIPGETLDRALRRLSVRPQDETWFTGVWPFAAWSAMNAYVEFWNRTGRRLVVADPTPGNVIVPIHDYHVGARLVSISSRREFADLASMLSSIYSDIVVRVEEEHERLRGLVGYNMLFKALLEVVGEEEGLLLLAAVAEEAGVDGAMLDELRSFVERVGRLGFVPGRMHFAAQRYWRWASLNPEATHAARASSVHQLFKSYGLVSLQDAYPEARARFFCETVFRDAPGPLREGLEDIIARLRRRDLAPDDLSAAVADLRAHLKLDAAEDYFLARLSYPHLKPEDEAGYVAAGAGGSQHSEMVVTMQDKEGQPFQIRHAMSPKEVGRLHRMFLGANLAVQFRPEHRFLVALNDRGHIVGGLFYEQYPEARTAHMEKVVVTERHHGLGVAGSLIEELCNRLRDAGFRAVTTGFFRPQFFYRYGFTVERRYAGLVRSLVEPGDETAASGSERPPADG